MAIHLKIDVLWYLKRRIGVSGGHILAFVRPRNGAEVHGSFKANVTVHPAHANVSGYVVKKTTGKKVEGVLAHPKHHNAHIMFFQLTDEKNEFFDHPTGEPTFELVVIAELNGSRLERRLNLIKILRPEPFVGITILPEPFNPNTDLIQGTAKGCPVEGKIYDPNNPANVSGPVKAACPAGPTAPDLTWTMSFANVQPAPPAGNNRLSVRAQNDPAPADVPITVQYT
jgi:hypothetical protein